MADLDIASEMVDVNGNALYVENADASAHDNAEDVHYPSATGPPRERPPCSMSKAREGDVEAQYWCGWALYVRIGVLPAFTCSALRYE